MLEAIIEPIKRHPIRAITVGTALTSVVAVGVRAYTYNDSQSASPDSCASPWAVTAPYARPGTHSDELYSGFTSGVVLRATIPSDTRGVEAGFRSPGDNHEWHTSNMLPGTGEVAVKLAIGDGPVEFGLRTIAPSGSKSCEITPSIKVDEHLGRLAFVTAKGKCPWLTPLNALGCLR